MKSGEEYEKLSKEVVQALNYGKKVTHNVKILGTLTEVKRQIDVKLDETNYDFVMYECKDWGKSIGVGVVGQFITDLEDVKAKHGAIIANSPFTKGAKNLASKKNVDLLHLVKTDSPKSKVGISAKVLVREKVINSIRFGVNDTSFDAPLLSMNPDEFIIVDDGERLTLNNFIRKRWNEGLNAEVTVGENLIEVDNAHIVDIKGDEYTVTKVTVGLVVIQQYFEGPWLIEEAQGLYNVLDDSFHAYGNMKSATISIKEMERTFVQLEADSVEPSKYSIILDVASEFRY